MDLESHGFRRRGLAALAGALLLLTGGAIAGGKTVKVKAGNHKGTTSEKGAVTLKISNRAIKNFSTQIGYSGACGQGGGPGYTITVKRIKIRASGKFSARVTLVGPVKSVPNVKGSLTGKASRGTVKGKIVDLALTHAKCNGYTETFTAHKH